MVAKQVSQNYHRKWNKFSYWSVPVKHSTNSLYILDSLAQGFWTGGLIQEL